MTHQVLHRKGDTVLPDDKDEKSLADKFSSFFCDKITRIRQSFSNSFPVYPVTPDSLPPLFSKFSVVSEETVIMVSPT